MRTRTLAALLVALAGLVAPAMTPAAHAVPGAVMVHVGPTFSPPAVVLTVATDLVVVNATSSFHTYVVSDGTNEFNAGASGLGGTALFSGAALCSTPELRVYRITTDDVAFDGIIACG